MNVIKMESKNELKEIDIKSFICYYFDIMAVTDIFFWKYFIRQKIT